MKRIVTYICLVIALPIVILGALWVFIKDAFRAGKQVGTAFLDYLET